MSWVLLKNSLIVSGLATLMALGFGLATALWLTGLDKRWRNGVLAVAAIALALPPFVVTNCWLHYLGSNGVWRGWLPLNIASVGGTIWILTLLTWPLTLFAVWGAWRRLEPAQLVERPLRNRLGPDSVPFVSTRTGRARPGGGAHIRAGG